MVEVVFSRDGRRRLFRFFASGHVEIPESSSDEFSLVCAAVSAVLQAARAGLEHYASEAIEAPMRKGHLEVTIPESELDDEKLSAIMTTAQLAIEQIALQYPQHLRVTERTETGYHRQNTEGA
ncbi:MAG TPA: ribosomal-processing cysteine protease Prp [Candidatus Acidoferrales bacterium]|nr:ribosomal-processing cysteine protease Prp [Candidatus Acidoferrales bacterium]